MMRNSETEEQAKTKWCPFARVLVVSDDINGSGNRVEQHGMAMSNPEQARCIGSECMAWGWNDELIGHCGLVTTRRETL